MIEFSFLGLIGYTLFIVITTCILTILFPKDVFEKNKSSGNGIDDLPQYETFKVGGVYGHKGRDDDLNNPFRNKPYYDMYIAVLDLQPSVDGTTTYLQYVFLNDEAMPHKWYSEITTYSSTIDNWDKWEYIKDIDLDSIVIER